MKATPGFIRILNLLSLSLVLFVVVRWFYAIYTYSVNLLYWDQWGFYDLMFNAQSYQEAFTYQFGPHRMGIGMVLTKMLATWSGWNTRVDAFTVGSLVFLAAVLALVLKRSIYRKVDYLDTVLAMLFLTTAQHEIFTATPIVAHGAMPLFLIMVYCLLWNMNSPLKYGMLLFVNFLLVFTGFGFFMGLISIFLFLLAWVKNKNKSRLSSLYLGICLFIAILTVAAFFKDYNFAPFPGRAGSESREWYRYAAFIFKGLGRFAAKTNEISILVGFVVFGVISMVLLIHAFRLWKGDKQKESRTIVILTSYTLLFLIGVSYGRAFLDESVDGAYASRYVTHLLPAAAGVYFHVCGRAHSKKLLRYALFLILLYTTFHSKAHFKSMEQFKKKKTTWVETYLSTERIDKANQEAQFMIHPAPEQTRLQEKLVYLKENKLNLYLGNR